MTTLAVIDWPGQNPGPIGLLEDQIISPNHWHFRLPLYAREISTNSATMADGNLQSVIDQKLEMQWRNGIDCVAYAMYPREPDAFVPGSGNDSFYVHANDIWKRHLSSPNKGLVKFCFWGGDPSMSTPTDVGDWPALAAAMASYMALPEYYKTFSDTWPVFFLFDPATWVTTWGGAAGAVAATNVLRAAVQALGMTDVYICGINGNGAPAGASGDSGCNAIGAYGVFPTGAITERTYASVTAQAVALWESQKATGFAVIPGFTCGWDPRPRVETDIWGYDATSPWNTYATPSQVAAHIKDDAFAWVAANPTVAVTDMVLGYADTEFTEGHPFRPHIGDGGLRYQLTAQTLGRQRENRRALRSRGIELRSR